MAAAASGRRKAAWLIALSMASSVAIFSKESGIVLLAAMLIYDLAFRGAASWRSGAPGYAAAAVPVCVFFFARHQVLAPLAAMHIGFGDNPLGSAGFWQARMTAVKVIGKYFWLLIWPGSLSCDYSFNQVPLANWPPHTGEDWQAPIAVALCLAAGAAALVSYRGHRPIFFFGAFFFATLAPTANLLVLIGTIMAERFLYLPSLAFAGCLVLAVYAVCSGKRGAAPAVLGAICLAFAARTYARNFDWRDDLSLWTSEVQVAPASYKAHMARASALVTPAGARVDEAIAEIEKAFAILQTVPDELNSPAPYIDAGSYYGQKGESLARRNPDGSLESTPESTMWYRKSLDTLLHARRIEAANNRENRRLEALRGRPYRDNGWYELYLELAAVYLRLSEPRKALEALEYGRKFQPVPEFFEKTADVHAALGDRQQEAIFLAAAFLMDQNDTRVAARLANLYQRTDPAGCAVRAGGQGLNMDCPRVHEDFCAASVQVERLYQEAGLGAGADNARQKTREMRCSGS
jgi:hypothetical protein